jgi:hypothetical protein
MSQEDGSWKAVKPHPVGTYFLTITWVSRAAKYLCEHREGDAEVRESRAYSYPHEVVDWLRRWVNRIEKQTQA